MEPEDLEQWINSVWDALEEGDIESAFEKSVRFVEQHPENAELQLALSAAAFSVDDPDCCRRAARRALDLIRRRPDPAARQTARLALLYLARAEFRMWRFQSAERKLRQLLQENEEAPEAWELLARILERTGRPEEAAAADRRAAELNPEAFAVPVRLSDRELEQAIRQAVEKLPEAFQQLVEELPIVVDEFPEQEMAASEEIGELPLPPDVLGLFVGTSRLDRSFFHVTETPGTIFLFKKNLEREGPRPETLTHEIAITLWHELAHYLGFEEEEMPDLGLE